MMSDRVRAVTLAALIGLAACNNAATEQAPRALPSPTTVNQDAQIVAEFCAHHRDASVRWVDFLTPPRPFTPIT